MLAALHARMLMLSSRVYSKVRGRENVQNAWRKRSSQKEKYPYSPNPPPDAIKIQILLNSENLNRAFARSEILSSFQFFTEATIME